MSVFEALALMSFTAVFAVAVLMKISTMSASFSHVIVTGVENGLPLSLEYRWMILWNFYTSTLMTGSGFAGGVALLLVQIGRHVDEPRISTLSFVFGAAGGLSSLLWLLGGVNGVIYMVSVLKKAR